MPATSDSEQRRAIEQRLALALEEVTLKPIDDEIVALVRTTPALSTCRTLDAVHVATALFFRAAEPALPICTFDPRMAQTTRGLGITVLGA